MNLRSSERKALADPAELPVEPFVENPPFPEEVDTTPASLIETDQPGDQALHSLIVYCLGSFRVYLNDQPIEDWHNGKSKALFKYLVAHHQRPVAKEILMELFWPDANPDAARNNLNVTIYSLRQILRQSHPDFAHILFQDDCYLLNPELQIWIDSEAFLDRFKKAQDMEQRGHQLQAIREYHAAEELYQGEYMEEDRYEDWLFPRRQKLQDIYLSLLDHLSQYYFDQEHYAACVSLCRKILAIEPCREDVHRRLMRCYCRQKQRYLGLRQYHQCLEALRDELDVTPSPRTTQLYECIRRHEQV